MTSRMLSAGVIIIIVASLPAAHIAAQTSTADEAIARPQVVQLPPPLSNGLNISATRRGIRFYETIASKQPRVYHKIELPEVSAIQFRNDGTISAITRNRTGVGIVNCTLNGDAHRKIELPFELNVVGIALSQYAGIVLRCGEEKRNGPRTWSISLFDEATGEIRRLPGAISDETPVSIITAARSPSVLCRSMNANYMWCTEPNPKKWKFPDLGMPSATALHPDGKVFAAGGSTPCGLYSTESGVRVGRLDDRLPLFDGDMTFSRSGRLIAVSGEQDDIGERTYVWDWKRGQALVDELGPGRSGSSVRFSNSERIVIAVDTESIISIWVLQPRSSVMRFVVGKNVTGGLSISNDDRMLAVACEDGIRVYLIDSLVRWLQE